MSPYPHVLGDVRQVVASVLEGRSQELGTEAADLKILARFLSLLLSERTLEPRDPVVAQQLQHWGFRQIVPGLPDSNWRWEREGYMVQLEPVRGGGPATVKVRHGEAGLTAYVHLTDFPPRTLGGLYRLLLGIAEETAHRKTVEHFKAIQPLTAETNPAWSMRHAAAAQGGKPVVVAEPSPPSGLDVSMAILRATKTPSEIKTILEADFVSAELKSPTACMATDPSLSEVVEASVAEAVKDADAGFLKAVEELKAWEVDPSDPKVARAFLLAGNHPAPSLPSLPPLETELRHVGEPVRGFLTNVPQIEEHDVLTMEQAEKVMRDAIRETGPLAAGERRGQPSGLILDPHAVGRVIPKSPPPDPVPGTTLVGVVVDEPNTPVTVYDDEESSLLLKELAKDEDRRIGEPRVIGGEDQYRIIPRSVKEPDDS